VAQVLKGIFREKCVFPFLAFNVFFFFARQSHVKCVSKYEPYTARDSNLK